MILSSGNTVSRKYIFQSCDTFEVCEILIGIVNTCRNNTFNNAVFRKI